MDRALRERHQLLQLFHELERPEDRQVFLDQLIATWLEATATRRARQSALVWARRLDHPGVELAAGQRAEQSADSERLRSALSALLVLSDDTDSADLVWRVLHAAAERALNLGVAGEALVAPMLQQLPLAHLQGLLRWSWGISRRRAQR